MNTVKQPTDMRLSVTFATVQLMPMPLTEEDWKQSGPDLQRRLHANERAELGFLFVHKAQCILEQKDGEATQGLLQSAMFDTEKSNGKQELKELLDAVKQTVMERLYETPVEGSILTP